jgi:membrane protein YdbS with pleckstrin-like domain
VNEQSGPDGPAVGPGRDAAAGSGEPAPADPGRDAADPRGGPTDLRAGPTDPLEPWPDTVRWQPVSRDLIWTELVQLGIAVVVVLGGLITGWALTGHWLFALGLAAAILLTLWRVWAIVRAVRAWGYAERDKDLLVRHGLLIRRLSIVPYARMQFVDVSAGPLERAFDLATVQLHTAAAASDARVPGLRPAEASRLRDRLTALGEDRAEGL